MQLLIILHTTLNLASLTTVTLLCHQQCKCAQPNEEILVYFCMSKNTERAMEYLQNLVSCTIDILKVLSVSKCNYSICVKIYTYSLSVQLLTV